MTEEEDADVENRFKPPELIDNQGGIDTKADVWSFGILAYELAMGSLHPKRYQNRSRR